MRRTIRTMLQILAVVPLLLLLTCSISPRAKAADVRVVYSLAQDNSQGSQITALTIGNGGKIYGVANAGGANGDGTVISVSEDGGNFQVLHSFSGTDGDTPNGRLLLDGSTLFGTAEAGAEDNGNAGAVFSIGTDGNDFSVLHRFQGTPTDGEVAMGGVTQVGSQLFGMTWIGGQFGNGTVYSMNMDGSGYQVIYSFNGADGALPRANLVANGNLLYGTTDTGGAGSGNVFSIATDGTNLQSIHIFTGGPEGYLPPSDVLIVGSHIFTTTNFGGANDAGTVFEMNLDGTGLQVIHAFEHLQSALPFALTVVGDRIYGSGGQLFSFNLDGSDFRYESVPGGEASRIIGLAADGNTLYAAQYFYDGSQPERIIAITVPEPSTLILAALGGLALLAFRRRR
jgi:uncharacterized repeat protein (TIGR03803 family)